MQRGVMGLGQLTTEMLRKCKMLHSCFKWLRFNTPAVLSLLLSGALFRGIDCWCRPRALFWYCAQTWQHKLRCAAPWQGLQRWAQQQCADHTEGGFKLKPKLGTEVLLRQEFYAISVGAAAPISYCKCLPHSYHCWQAPTHGELSSPSGLPLLWKVKAGRLRTQLSQEALLIPQSRGTGDRELWRA